MTDSELGRHLLTIRGFHFIFGAGGDPYALLLRAESDDPVVLGHEARKRGPLYRSDATAWVAASHGLAGQILADPRFELRHGDGDGPQQHVLQDAWNDPKMCHVLPLDDAFLNLPRADYARLTTFAEPALGTAALGRRRAEVEKVVHRVLDGLPGEFDLMADFARTAAVEVLSELFAISGPDRERFAKLCPVLGVALDAGLCPPRLNTARELVAAVDGLRELFRDRRDGVLCELTGPADDVLAAAVLTAVVGIEVTANLICNAVSALLDDPEQWRLLREDPDRAAAAVEETLRHSPPLRMENRVAAEDVELAGQDIEADSQVVVLVAAANRDPDVYPDPDRFDLTRRPAAKHLSLTEGTYGSFVAPFVRLQATAALQALVTAMPELRKADVVLRRMRSPVTGGVLRFPVAAA